VITVQLVQDKGLGSLGAVVLGAGILQILFGLLRVGRWFQAISVPCSSSASSTPHSTSPPAAGR
jgi:MFS superfamily sulfate permease-like transporter